MNNNVLLELNNLQKHFPVQEGLFRRTVGVLKAVDDVSLFVRRGETLGLVGESGCGKTTLGKMIVRLHKPTAGKINYTFENEATKDLLSLSGEESFKARRLIQMVFQDPYSSLNPVKTILAAFDEPMRVHGIGDAQARKQRTAELLQSVNLRSEYMHRYPHEFSGGQLQRISIARALCVNPELVVCDEPVSALDVSIQAQVLNLMKDLQRQMNLTYVFIAHDLSVVEYMSNRIAVMYLGKIVELAGAADLYSRYRHPYTRALLSAVPIPQIGGKKRRVILEGDVPSPIHPPKGCRFHTRCKFSQERCAQEEPALAPYAPRQDHWVACHFADTLHQADDWVIQ
jgi:oligopeptide/dipeptide ABC transporter ATP-binding protein